MRKRIILIVWLYLFMTGCSTSPSIPAVSPTALPTIAVISNPPFPFMANCNQNGKLIGVSDTYTIEGVILSFSASKDILTVFSNGKQIDSIPIGKAMAFDFNNVSILEIDYCQPNEILIIPK